MTKKRKTLSITIERILECIDSNNSILKSSEEVDPLGLAQAVWQDIYINTAKSPLKCLYNVVELFIFKFLSDLEILKKPDNFDFVYQLSLEKGGKEALRYYAVNSRPKIRELFPAGKDDTTIINGTIFVSNDGKPVNSQANLFKNSLRKYNQFGSLRNVKKEFKTKLFETFLKQSSDKSKLGQFFTPRKVVRAMVDMADVEALQDGARICDPFCGVGGFIAETIQKPKRRKDFKPNSNGKIDPKVSYVGYDKGTDEDDERVIILAKANLVIYLSDLIERHPSHTKSFAKALNSIFNYLTQSNLGTLKLNIVEEEKFHLILTNPPYITSGVSSIRDEIKSEGLEKHYNIRSKGVDGLALQWIIRSLKKGGKAFIVVSDGILESGQNRLLREHILQECDLNAIISLPRKTFFNTPQKTFILVLTKKEIKSDIQTEPIFTYLVSNIGETLDVDRFEIEGKSDLERSKELFNLFKGAPKNFPIRQIADPRCKIQTISKMSKLENWNIDRIWTQDEKIKLGVLQPVTKLGLEQYIKLLNEKKSSIDEGIKKLRSLKKPIPKLNKMATSKVPLDQIFDIYKGSPKYTKKYMRDNSGSYPVFSSKTKSKGIISEINSFDYDIEAITWTTDGVFAGTPFLRSGKFSMTTHCGALILKDKFKKKIDLEYVYYFLRPILKKYAISEDNKRLTVELIKVVEIEIPIKDNGDFDVATQKQFAKRNQQLQYVKEKLRDELWDIQEIELES